MLFWHYELRHHRRRTYRLHHKRRLIVPFHQVDKRIFGDIEKGTPFPTRRHELAWGVAISARAGCESAGAEVAAHPECHSVRRPSRDPHERFDEIFDGRTAHLELQWSMVHGSTRPNRLR